MGTIHKDRLAEVDSSNPDVITNRYIRGDGADEIIAEYRDSGANLRYHHQDERGSTVAWSDEYGNMAAILCYDEYGIPAAGNPGRFQYTGQMWLPELGLYNYKARMYSPTLGRFMQTTRSPEINHRVRSVLQGGAWTGY